MKKFVFILAFGCFGYINGYSQCNAGEITTQIMTHTDNWGYECYWQITPLGDNCGTNTLIEGGNLGQVGCNGGGQGDASAGQGYGNNAMFMSEEFCLTIGASYTFHYVDDWGDGGAEFDVMMSGMNMYHFMGGGEGDSFDFTASEPAQFDARGLGVTTLSYLQAGQVALAGEFQNRGAETITDIEFNYQVDGGEIVTASLNGLNVPSSENFEIEHPQIWDAGTEGEYEVQLWISSINGNADENPTDDIAQKTITVGPPVPNILDSYIGLIPSTEIIAGPSEGVDHPRDLDFHPVLTRYELWVILKSTEDEGGLTVKISNAGQEGQTELVQQDGNAWHFMSLPTGIAFSENTNFATSPGVFDANHNGAPPFTGPTLWSSDPAIYAQPSGGNGSHLDMLHESPYSMGIAHEFDNKFWVTCGAHNEIMSYDFREDHGPGNDYHGDAHIYKYPIPGYDEDPEHEVPDHLVLDKATGWLYVCNSQQNRIIRININSGTPGMDAVAYEQVEIYKFMDDFEWEIYIDEGLNEPTGIDVIEDRLIVSNYNTGDINLYDISGNEPQLLSVIPTGLNGIMGVKVGPDGLIWYVNSITDEVRKVTLDPVGVNEAVADIYFNTYPNPANDVLFVDIASPGFATNLQFDLFDVTGRAVAGGTHFGTERFELPVGSLSPGSYFLSVSRDGNFLQTQHVMIQR